MVIPLSSHAWTVKNLLNKDNPQPIGPYSPALWVQGLDGSTLAKVLVENREPFFT